MNKVATPTASPDSGLFDVTHQITLTCATPGALIYYTLDGTTPNGTTTLFNPYRLIPIEAKSDGEKGLRTRYIVRAIAVKEGMEDSEVATFVYTVNRRDKNEYVSKEIHPGIWMISDYDNDKMFLVRGHEKALLIDAGYGSGNLREYVESLTEGLPLEVLITHAHPDHVALVGQFQDDFNVYMHRLDMPRLNTFIKVNHFEIDTAKIKDVVEGFVFDLGGRKLKVYEVPGHSAGSIVLMDEENGYLFSGDAVGSNRATIVDSVWMQMPGMALIDEYLSTLRVFRSKVGGRLKEIFTGHNDQPIIGETYLNNLERAAQNLVDWGDEVLVPSFRPPDVSQVIVGDRFTDPNWVSINVTKDKYLTRLPEEIATLSNLQLSAATLDVGFIPSHYRYNAVVDKRVTTIRITLTATSSRYRGIKINGASVKSGVPYTANLAAGDNQFAIVVTAPNGKTTHRYTLRVM